MTSLIKKLIRNTLSNFGLTFFSVVLGFIALPILVGEIGDDGYGLITLVGTVLGYLNVLGAGVPGGTVKYVAEFDAEDDNDQIHRVINTSFTFFLGVGIVACAGLFAFGSLGGLDAFNIDEANRDTARYLVYIAGIVALMSWPASVLQAAMKGLQEHHTKNIIEGTTNVARYGMMIVAALAGFGIIGVFIAQQLAFVVRWLWLTVAVRRRLPGWVPNPFAFDKKTFWMIFGISFWLLLIKLAGLLNYETDHVILGVFLPMAALTTYHVVTRPFKIIKKASSLFNSAIMPAVSATEVIEGKEGVHGFAYEGARYNNAFIAPLAIIGLYLGGPFIVLWMGEKYAEYAWIAQLSCAFQLLWQSNSLLARVCYGVGKVRPIALIAVGMALTNVALSLVLVPHMGVEGVILATVIAGCLGPVLQYVWVLPTIQVDRWRYFTTSVLRPQIPHLVAAAGLVPFWGHFQSISSWTMLVVHVVAMGVPLYIVSWFGSVELEHREWVYEKIKNVFNPSEDSE